MAKNSPKHLTGYRLLLCMPKVCLPGILKSICGIFTVLMSQLPVSKVTDKILPLIAEWQSRPLDRVYPIVFLDAIHFKVRQDNRIINKAAYSVMGINLDGMKDILGIWIGENESASFWLAACVNNKL